MLDYRFNNNIKKPEKRNTMLAIMKYRQMQSLATQYTKLKAEAGRLMKAGDLHRYIITLSEIEKVKNNYFATARQLA